MAIVFKF